MTSTTPTRVAVVSAGVSEPSTTRLIADRIAQRTVDTLRERGTTVTVTVIELAPHAGDIARSLVSGFPRPVQTVIDHIASADAMIVCTPVYKAGISGLFKSFFDLLENDLLIAKPVVLAATGGTARHAMVVDEQLRPLFAFFRAITMPTSLYVAPEDWGSSDLSTRVARAATELAVIVDSGAARAIARENWAAHQHQFAGNATHSGRPVDDIDFTTDLMQLATGGS